jgi:hypothetical protein
MLRKGKLGLMATATRSGIKPGVTMLIVALAVAGFFYLRPTSGGPEDDVTEKVSLRVDFTPKERVHLPRSDERVKVIVSCECVLVVNDFARLSPWTKTVTIPRGAKLVLNATQPLKGTMWCSINGKASKKVEGPGTAVCIHNH